MAKEIGSEYWNAEPVRRDKVYLLSGRTALDFILQDILKEHNISTALLPSYCCHTMIEPFVRNGISVRFYDVYFDAESGLTADVLDVLENEIFYYMTYFGFNRIANVDIESIRDKAEIIIQDETHSWLTAEPVESIDYSFASYRKWTGLSGIASALKYNGKFDSIPTSRNETYCRMRRDAAAMKSAYLNGNCVDKNAFLNLFEEAEEFLEKDYVDYLPETDALAEFVMLDIKRISEERRRNAQILIEGLTDIGGIQLMFNELQESDVPLFVPVLVKEHRAELRKFLTGKAIYCPVHWPISSFHQGISDRAKIIYERELSLVCDQRYSTDDMYQIIGVIRQFYKR